MKLYDMKLSPNSRRVRIALAEKGVQLPMEECFDMERVCLTDHYLRRYPFRLVPMLELDDGTQIGESTAICRYIEELYPEPNLFGRTALERAMVEMWIQRVTAEGELGAEERFRNSYPPFAARGLAGSEDPVPQIPALVERGTARFHRFLRMLDRQLVRDTWLTGSRLTMADICALCAVDMGKSAGVDLPQDLKNLQRWYKLAASRPSAGA